MGTIFFHFSMFKFGIIDNFSLIKLPLSLLNMWVPLFFIVSAFTLSLSYNSRNKQEKHPIKNFFVRRVFRICPLFYLLCIIAFFLLSNSPFLVGKWVENLSINLKNLIFHFLFLYGFSFEYINSFNLGEWSLFNEMWFYVIFPVLFFLVNKRKNLWYLFLMLSIFSFVWVNFFLVDINYDWYYTPISTIYPFMLWMSLFKIKDMEISKHKLRILSVLNIALFILIPLAVYFIKPYFPDNDVTARMRVFVIANLALFAYLFIKWQYNLKGEIAKFLKWSGIVSYSLYLMNILIIKWFTNVYENTIFTFISHSYFLECLLIVLTIWILYFLSYFTYRFIEQPWIKLGKKVIEKYSG